MMPKHPYPKGYENFEETLNDPLANVEQFNIIQFLSNESEFNLPAEEPLEPPENFVMKNDLQNIVSNPHQNANPMYQMPSGQLPDSPPITDISGNGSSGSPSTNSDPPYSPEAYANYALGARRMNDGGLILGVHQASAYDCKKYENISNQLASPSVNACFMSPYPPSQQPTPRSYAQSISPDCQNENQGFAPGNLFNPLNVSSDGSINSQNSEMGASSRKRSRIDPSIDPTRLLHAALGANALASPAESMPCDDSFGQPIIKFTKFQEDLWNCLYDANGRQVNQLQVHVVADKGFNFSPNDGCFVNQKKNHFQISVHVEACDSLPPRFLKFNGSLIPIKEFKLAFSGVKSEMPSSEITIRQSKTDRRPHPHNPVVFEIHERRMTKVTVPRLHFSETTLNNQRKNLRPNPEQKYFLLVVRLFASINDDNLVLIQSYASEKVIVRATNPGSFEQPELEAAWNKNGGALFSQGPVSVGTDRTFGKLTVDGDIYTTGRVICPSDIRLKENITEKESSEALTNLCKLRIVDYFYKPEVAAKWGLDEDQRHRTGVIAQELAAVLPDAVRDIGDYLTVNESRVFYETVLATQELCRLTGDLDQKIDEKVEEITKKLAKYAATKKMLSSKSSNMNSEATEKQSIMSGSHLSLASILTQKNTKQNRRSTSKRSGRSSTQSRLAQGTIMFLVGVMALCLVTMSALYVLDWHNRNFGHNRVHSYHNATISSKDAPANIVISPTHFLPFYQPDAPPIQPDCLMHECLEYCCDLLESEEIPEYDQKIDTITKRSEIVYSDFKEKPFGSDVRISLPQFNMEIDGRYCIEKSCNTRRGIYNLYIPISKYFPNYPIEVKFEVPSSKMVSNCGYVSDFNNKKCGSHHSSYIEEYPASEVIFDNIFTVDAGYFSQSEFRFRVSYLAEACYSPEDTFGGAYDEFNLIFYRSCNLLNS